MKRLNLATAAALWLLAAPSEASGGGRAEADSLRAAVDSAFRPLVREHDIPGLAVAVTVDGEEYHFSYGLASREAGVPVSKETIFELGSISKVFTATLAAFAEASGKLSWSDHPGRFVPELRGSPLDRATLLHLGTYTAGGLPLQFPQEVAGRESMLRYFRNFAPDSGPGARRTYSNPSLGLFGHVAALALGGDFATLMERTLFRELGLRRTYVVVPDQAMSGYAWGYNAANRPVRVNPGVLASEAYGVKSTAADMIRFVELNIRPRGLSGPFEKAVRTTQVARFRVGPMIQGLGWEQYPYPLPLNRLLAGNSTEIIMKSNPAAPVPGKGAGGACTLFNKTGSTNGFGAYVAFVPERRTGIVILANRNFPIPARVRAAHSLLERIGRESSGKPCAPADGGD
ncbi:MAG TPA: class C beta-lactamase [Allosphingosinicella sp.]|nr:class C beta-lactamase [Allosphingosinicella sp.]